MNKHTKKFALVASLVLTIQSAQAFVLPVPDKYKMDSTFESDSVCDLIHFEPLIMLYSDKKMVVYKKDNQIHRNKKYLTKVAIEQITANCKAPQKFTIYADNYLAGTVIQIAERVCIDDVKTVVISERHDKRYSCIISDAKLNSAREWLASNPDVNPPVAQPIPQGNPREVEDAILQGGQKAVQNKSNFCAGRLFGFPC
jgi:hypothetical protein